MSFSLRQSIEVFHIALLAELGSKLDKRLYAIKGGCNLRFFFNSPRFSEDLDIDVKIVETQTLKRKVDRILEGRPLALVLGSKGIVIDAVSRPKQTATTQRWKVGFSLDGAPAHTKIEFSRRGLDPEPEFSSIDSVLCGRYAMPRVFTSHYGVEAALLQKVQALAGRTETQARDIFDIDLLLARNQGRRLKLPEPLRSDAASRALSLEYSDFKSQVVAYLSPSEQESYDSENIWQKMVLSVKRAIEGDSK